MTIDQAKARAVAELGITALDRVCAWHGLSGACLIGVSDGEFRYVLGRGKTWDEALQNAKDRYRK